MQPAKFPADVQNRLLNISSGVVEETRKLLSNILTASRDARFNEGDVESFTPLIRDNDVEGMRRALLKHLHERDERVRVKEERVSVVLKPKPMSGNPPRASIRPCVIAISPGSGKNEPVTLVSRMKSKFQKCIRDPSNAACQSLSAFINGEWMANVLFWTGMCFAAFLVAAAVWCVFGMVTEGGAYVYQDGAGIYSMEVPIKSALNTVADGSGLSIVVKALKQLNDTLNSIVESVQELKKWKSGVNMELYGGASTGVVTSVSTLQRTVKVLIRKSAVLAGVCVQGKRSNKLAMNIRRSLTPRVSSLSFGDVQSLTAQRDLIIAVNASVWAKIGALDSRQCANTSSSEESTFGLQQKVEVQQEVMADMKSSIESRLQVLEQDKSVQGPLLVAPLTCVLPGNMSNSDFEDMIKRMRNMQDEIRSLKQANEAGTFTMGLCFVSGMALASMFIALSTPAVISTAVAQGGMSGTVVYGVAKFLSFFGLQSAIEGLALTGSVAAAVTAA